MILQGADVPYLSPAFLAGAAAVISSLALLGKAVGPLLVRNGTGGREVTRTLTLMEQQQKDIEAALTLLRDGQQERVTQQTTLQSLVDVVRQTSTTLERVADRLHRSTDALTAISANVEHTQIDMAAHRLASEQAVGQVAEIHAHVMRGRKR